MVRLRLIMAGVRKVIIYDIIETLINHLVTFGILKVHTHKGKSHKPNHSGSCPRQ